MKKSSKRFVISTDAENSNKFSVATAGIDISSYNQNPLMLWMHQRPKGERRDEILPLGNFVDLEFKDGKLYGVPTFDTTDTFAESISNKVENGTIRMASAGLIPLEWGRDAEGRMWLLKSKLVEVSIVDIGSNPDALAVALYDENDNLITLSDGYFKALIPDTNQNADTNMKLIQLSADQLLPIIGLADGAKPEEVQAKIQELVTLSSTQKNTIQTLTGEKKTAEDKATELQAELDKQINLANEAKVTALVDGAVTARKITADQKDSYIKLAKADFDSVKSLLDGMKENPSVKSVVEEAKGKSGEEFQKLSWSELDKSGKLVALKADHPEIFKAKFKEQFGRDYKD